MNKLSTLLSLIIEVLGKRCGKVGWGGGGGAVERGLNKWNQGKSLKYLNVMLFWGHSHRPTYAKIVVRDAVYLP